MTDSNYDDIINLPHHVSRRHPQMSLYSRAAQFAPFAALSGYEEAIAETARCTVREAELIEDDRQLLDRKLSCLSSRLTEHPVVSITYFQPDMKKSGGKYMIATGIVREIDERGRMIRMDDGKLICIDTIAAMESEVFAPDGDQLSENGPAVLSW